MSPQIKTINFLNNIQAKREAIAAGAFDSVLLNWAEQLTECTDQQYVLCDGRPCERRLWNAACSTALPEKIVIGWPKNSTSTSKKAAIPLTQLYHADECFLTNTSMEIMPVTSVDRRPVGDGKPGSLTQKPESNLERRASRYGENLPQR